MSKLTILVNLGTPDQPFEKEVRTYLREFLSDKYVIRLPRIFWLTLLKKNYKLRKQIQKKSRSPPFCRPLDSERYKNVTPPV